MDLSDQRNPPIQDLIRIKEKELQDMNDFRFKCAKEAIERKDNELKTLNCKFNQLKEDFNYNLSLIEDRDTEVGLKIDINTFFFFIYISIHSLDVTRSYSSKYAMQ